MRLQPALSSSPISWGSILLHTLLLTPSSVLAKKDHPSIVSNKFDHAPVNMQYFDDSDVIMFSDYDTNNVFRSTDAGVTWNELKGGPEVGKEWNMYMHPFISTRAYVLSDGTRHWMTDDRGETWKTFVTDAEPSAWRPAFNFHAGDPDRIIFNGKDCGSLLCEEVTMYTTTGFRDEKSKMLRTETSGCHWAKETKEFTTGDEELDKNRILCISRGKYSWFSKDYRLVVSDNFFQVHDDVIQEFEPDLEFGRIVSGVVEMAAVKGYIVAAAQAQGTDEMALYVSDDTKKWHRAIFPKDHRLDEEAYTILESTGYSIQVDVQTTRSYNPMGTLLSSNSNGTYFTRLAEHTNRNQDGFVDFEKMSGVQGIVLLNIVDNWKDVEEDFLTADKEIKSQISFDDGRTWQPLKVKGDDKKDLHLHSVTDLRNIGKVFSSPAPGLVMGVGNTGKHLSKYKDGDTYVSDDAGITWLKALDGPHKYEFGDSGSILVAIAEGKTNKLQYSLNHGKDWKHVKMDEDIIPLVLTTTMDSTSLKFMMIATTDPDRSKDFRVVSIDFDDLHERQCKNDDMEKWWARVDEKGDPTCLMGHKQYYMRRKADADCFIKQEFKDPEPQYETCSCTDDDFECDFNFVRSEDRKECVKAGDFIVPDGECKGFGPDTTFKGSSGWRKIPGNDCKRTDGAQKDDLVDRKCADVVGPPADGLVKHTMNSFKTNQGFFTQKIYLERTDTSEGSDETILMLIGHSVHISKDSGKTWKEILQEERIVKIRPHPYFNDYVYFIGASDIIYYTADRGEHIHKFKVPSMPDTDHYSMEFHEHNKDWIIWTGTTDCGLDKPDCHGVASITTDRGDHWRTLQRYVKHCEFIKQNPPQQRSAKLIFCTKLKHESTSSADNPWQLVSSSDFFEQDDQIEVHFDDIIDFATMSEFIVVAAKNSNHELRVDASVDGNAFAQALFPSNFKPEHQSAYTVLDSSTHSVFLHVTTSVEQGSEYGTIVKSNSNGTSYVLSISNVNRDRDGFVDFEKMYGLEGVALVNIVTNFESLKTDGKKALKTVITHNDGAQWRYIRAPAQNFEGKSYNCDDRCSLNIHGFTERIDRGHTYANARAVGLMVATGNVGDYLSPRSEADTFMTTNAGIDWKPVKQGTWTWQYGDLGALIVIAPDSKPTKSIFYTRDEGDTWVEYQFSDKEVKVLDVTSVPSTMSRNFVIWCATDDGLETVNIDFTGLTDRVCKFDDKQPENEDYYLWSPKHPTQDNDCLFGHVSQYHRKKTSADCYNPPIPDQLHYIGTNCTCSRQDFECDFNYEGNPDGTCTLVEGLPPPNHAESCALNPDQEEYFEPSGYRRIPLTTCQGGQELEFIGRPKPCPGKEGEFEKKHGLSGVGLFFAITIPLAVAAGIGYWVYENWSHRGFGQIRLGEQSTFDDQAPYVKYPVMAISALVAGLLILPSLLGAAWHEVSKLWSGRGGVGRYTTRRSFGRESDYAVVDEDEGELLGDESDEEV